MDARTVRRHPGLNGELKMMKFFINRGLTIAACGLALLGCITRNETVYHNPERAKIEFENEKAALIVVFLQAVYCHLFRVHGQVGLVLARREEAGTVHLLRDNLHDRVDGKRFVVVEKFVSGDGKAKDVRALVHRLAPQWYP